MPVKVCAQRRPQGTRNGARPRAAAASSPRMWAVWSRPPACENFWPPQRDGHRTTRQRSKTCLHDSVAEVVRKQAELGLDIVNDGEYGKTISWSRYVLAAAERFRAARQREAGMPAAVVGRDRREFAGLLRRAMTAPKASAA